MSGAIIFCADPLSARRVDPHWAAEADAVREAGRQVVLIDHDALLSGDLEAAVRRVPAGTGPAWYRGWMIPTGRYDDLSRALADRGTEQVTSPAAYARAHELPGWYDTFAAVTPASVWSSGVPVDLAALVAPLGGGAAVVKDYVKSRKHEWLEACYVPDLTDLGSLQAVVDTFVDRQADDLAGGVVVRAFESFDAAGEARVWWLDDDPVLIGPHPDTPRLDAHPDLENVRPLVAALACRFVTTDLAQRVDGTWRVVEVGDGQVSDRPAAIDPAALVGALLGR